MADAVRTARRVRHAQGGKETGRSVREVLPRAAEVARQGQRLYRGDDQRSEAAPVIYSYAGKEPFKSSNSSPFFKCSLSKADSKKYLSSSQK